MKKTSTMTPIAFKIALFNLTAGVVGLITSLMVAEISRGITEVSIGLLCLGLGEYINNPIYKPPLTATGGEVNPSGYFCRRRNVSSLGNLFDIAGLLSLAIGLATLFF